MIFKTLADAEQFIKDFRNYAKYDTQEDNYEFRFSVGYGNPNHIISNLIHIRQKEFYLFDCEINWYDRENTAINDPIKSVYQ